ncbi:VWA domain-containing protein [Terracoccus luteus]|uniref:Mg-protoporphyrin IX chelatase n=1 Tax=Terracoccus luteus TaxID=53356 RepID=A0A839Q305_9MICO|nr:VWA domain-containing protein [Terracoccus luteus]MBB2987502.1 magnesium chelatase subunit D [Terracoccus luteus]MCP2173153.1 magnesium chelatase subunit D [Terracoccus luteus]
MTHPSPDPARATTARPAVFPFSAVVGSDDLSLALTLSAVSPAIGGVLVRGEKGTAKSTAVRGLADVMPDQHVVTGCRFGCDPDAADPTCPDGPHGPDAAWTTRPARLVELPVGATDDRVTGSLDLEAALGRGVTAYEPGLLAAANRGILYVDEVNLLHDHLVDLLLDAAAMGRNTVERDGVSVSHAASLVLVGTMNPEEGELRPQLLDRFGLTVEVAAPREPALRAEVVRRRLAFDASPASFTARFSDEQDAVRDRIADARSRLGEVELSDAMLTTVAEVCAAFEVDGLRADIVTARAAMAHAAWAGRDRVTKDDVRAAARLALPHRRRRNPFDAPGLDEELLDRVLGDDEPEPDGPDDTDPDSTERPDAQDGDGGPGDGAEPTDRGSDNRSADDSSGATPPRQPEPARATDESPGQDQATDVGRADRTGDTGDTGDGTGTASATVGTAGAGTPTRARLLVAKGVGRGAAGRRSRAVTSTGAAIGASTAASGRVHLAATVRAAAPHQRARGRRGPERVLLERSDVRRTLTEGRESNLVLLCVDASGSMAARRRMEAVKTAVLSLLLDAYQRRDKVGLVTFRGEGAQLVLPPTGSVDIAARRLQDLPHGGRTPLAEGLLVALETLRLERIRDPRRRPLLVVVTDGRATAGASPLERSALVARALADEGVDSVVVDCESGRFRLGLAGRLAAQLGAEHLPVGELAALTIVEASRGRAA